MSWLPGVGGKVGDQLRRSSGAATAPIPARITDDLDHADRARRILKALDKESKP